MKANLAAEKDGPMPDRTGMSSVFGLVWFLKVCVCVQIYLLVVCCGHLDIR